MRTINSPGIQVNEIDLSNYALGPVGTTVFAAGFTTQGPVDEVLNITTLSELENVYGAPTTTAEAYFYESCKQVLQSPGRLYCTRLPYGSGSGDGFTQLYSALLYPATRTQEEFVYATSAVSVQSIHILGDEGIEGVDFEHGIDSVTLAPVEQRVSELGENTTFTLESTRKVGDITVLSVSSVKVTYRTEIGGDKIALGIPRQVTLTLDEYQMIANQEFDWDDLKDSPDPVDAQWLTYIAEDGTDYNLMQNVGAIVLNTRQTTNDENGVGYYISIADNTHWGPENVYESILGAKGLTSNNTIVRRESELDTYPSETENIVTIPSNRFTRKLNSTNGADSVSRDVENIPKYDFGSAYYDDSVVISVVKVDHSNYQPNLLTPSIIESYIGSFDGNKKTIGDSGGVKRSFFLQDAVNQSSSRIKLFINPNISKGVQWVSTTSESPNPTVKTRVEPTAQYLFANGVYNTSFANETNAKDVGNVAAKLEHALRLIENTDTYTIDIVIDGGLSTVHTNNVNGVFDDTKRLPSALANLGTEDAQAAIKWRQVYEALNATASTLRKDCVAIVDPLRQVFLSGNAKQSERRNLSFTEAVYKPLKNLLAAADSNYVGIYGNWGLGNSAALDRNIWLPMSGAIAATYAKSDAVSQPWFAPAGFTRGQLSGFLDLACNPTQKQRDNLYTISVNPVVFFSGEGFVIYGQKTCQKKPTAFDRINVRRLFLTLERTTAKACKYFVFEPNTAMTRTRLLTTISPIFDNAKRTQGLYDFMIVCDDRNNPSDAVDRNELIVDIYIKPVKAAEFILINFIATRTGQDFSEIA